MPSASAGLSRELESWWALIKWGMALVKDEVCCCQLRLPSEIGVILFLDFDGVLHPDAVYRRLDGRIELRASGELFMWAPLLEEILEDYPELRIVLSTSWVRVLGFRRARERLPAKLAERVIGATWHSAMGRNSLDVIGWDHQTRFQQISAYLSRSPNPTPWLAIDDDDVGWPDEQKSSLILTDPVKGLASVNVQNLLRHQLEIKSQVHGEEDDSRDNGSFCSSDS